MEVIIDFAQEKDFAEVDRLLSGITGSIASKGKKWANYKVDSDEKDRFNIYKQILSNKNNHVFVAKNKENILGCVNFQVICNIRHGWLRGHIEEVVVKEGYRNMGIGTRLLVEVKNYCKQNKIRVIKLMCGKQLKDSYRFYLKNGFKELDHGLRCELEEVSC